jgi:hypothetical protein
MTALLVDRSMGNGRIEYFQWSNVKERVCFVVSLQRTRVAPSFEGPMTAIKKGSIRVGNMDFRWSVFRQPTWARGAHDVYVLRGLAILVEPPEQSRRELILEFEMNRARHGDMPQHQRFHVPDVRLIEAVESAMRAGYDPASRGKRFVYEAGALQPR